MKTKSIPNNWLVKNGHRMDCNPYMGGAVEARLILEKLACMKQPLNELTKGHNGGIYNGPVFKRRYVDGPKYGVPFLTSATMLRSDLSVVPYLSKEDATSKKLSYLELKPGMIMISCSGAIGNMIYVRSDLDGYWSCQDQLKVVGDDEKIQSGYLFAFLKSKYGLPIVISGTYGAIIQHIEPVHIEDLPVPRLGVEVESEVHRLIEKSANLRVKASDKFQTAEKVIYQNLSPPMMSESVAKEKQYGITVKSSELRKSTRLEGYFYNPKANMLKKWAEQHPNGYAELGDLANVYDVPPFKHIYVNADEGTAFYPSGDLFRLNRDPTKYLSNSQTKGLAKYVINKGCVLLARSGQLGGIIGRPQYTDSALNKTTTSDHVIRISSTSEEVPTGYIYAYLATKHIGYPLTTRTITGKSVPALWPIYLRDIPIVKCKPEVMSKIHDLVEDGFESRVTATEYENKAIALIEKAIEQAALAIQ